MHAHEAAARWAAPITAADAARGQRDDAGRRSRAAPAPPRRSPAIAGRRQDGHRRDRRRHGINTTWFIASPRPTTRRSRSRSWSRTSTAASAARWPRRSPSTSCRRSSDGRVEITAQPGRMADLRHPDRHRLRRALPRPAQAGLGRDGERLPRRGPGARPQRRDQDPGRPPRRATTSSSSASAARRRTRRACRTRTSSRSTTAARPRAPTTSRWSTSTGARSRS